MFLAKPLEFVYLYVEVRYGTDLESKWSEMETASSPPFFFFFLWAISCDQVFLQVN